MDRLDFSGRLIYFDYQQRDCSHPSSPRSQMTVNSASVLSSHFQPHWFYHRPTLSFRADPDHPKSFNLTPSTSRQSASHLLNEDSSACSKKIDRTIDYVSSRQLNSQLSASFHLYSDALVNSLNLLLQLFTTNQTDCTTIRLRSTPEKSASCRVADANVFSMKKLSVNQWKYPIELIGRFSTMKNEYQSCREPKRHDTLVKQQGTPSRIYYITSLFDEPFLMLRKRPYLQTSYHPSQTNLEDLRGLTFDFHELQGYCVDLAEKICSVLNITCKFRIVQDGNFGSKNASTGLWNGTCSLDENLLRLDRRSL